MANEWVVVGREVLWGVNGTLGYVVGRRNLEFLWNKCSGGESGAFHTVGKRGTHGFWCDKQLAMMGEYRRTEERGKGARRDPECKEGGHVQSSVFWGGKGWIHVFKEGNVAFRVS